MSIVDEDYDYMIGRYVKYIGSDTYILRGQTRLGVVIEYNVSTEWDDNDDEWEVVYLTVKINNTNFELSEDDVEYLSPEEVETFQEQEKREAHADKYL